MKIVPQDKLFIARVSGSNRPDNQVDLLAVAKDFGYKPVFFEDLSLREAVSTMLGASRLIGPHGAGWANALFCQTGVSALIWTWQASRLDNWFANIASVRQMSYRISTETSVSEGQWNLRPEILLDYLEREANLETSTKEWNTDV